MQETERDRRHRILINFYEKLNLHKYMYHVELKIVYEKIQGYG